MDLRYLSIDLAHTPIAYLYLQRPKLHNAFDDAMIAELTQALGYLATLPDLRVLVLGARGDSFCAGGDLNWMQRMVDYSFEENQSDAKAMADMYHALAHFPLPTIAMVQGNAFGGGVGLVAACDLVVAAADAKFCLSEVKLGLIPATICPYLVKAIGARATKRYALTAEAFTASEAMQLGLVHVVASPDALEAQVLRLCQQLLNNSPEALKATKQLIAYIVDTPQADEVYQASIDAIANIRISKEGQSGLRAFLAKQPAPWLPPKTP